MRFTKPKKAIGLDIGSHSVKAVQMSRSSRRLCIDQAGIALLDRDKLNADPDLAHAQAINEALAGMQVSAALVVGALPGQPVVIRYPRIADASKDRLNDAVMAEAAKSIPYDLAEVFLDWDVLEEVEGSGEGQKKKQLRVMLVAAKHDIIRSRVQIFDAAGVQPGVLSVDSLALVDAAEVCDNLHVGETVALLNIGLTSANVHFVKDGKSNFIRDINWGARELIQAVARERACPFGEAERILQEEGMAGEDGEEVPESVIEPPEASAVLEPEPEPVKEDPFGNVFGGGGGGLLDPLDDELGGGKSALVSRAKPGGGESEKRELRDIISGPLAKMVAEVRRSFDYYEHQLYERPVDRLILCGGIAQLPLVGEMLLDELGVETVETADPSRSALLFADDVSVMPLLEQPAQFMVAVGLAARGMAEL